MIPPLDPFALHFDSIEIDPTRAPTRTAIEHALSLCAPPEDALLTTTAAGPDFEAPGFHLLDDAGGRFVVDRDMGVVSLKDETWLAREPGAVHAVRLRVVERSGESYEMDLQLRLTGLVPQVVGAEEFAAIAGLAPAPAVADLPAPTRPLLPWPTFAITTAVRASAEPLGGEHEPFGALLSTTMPSKGGSTAFLTLADAPPRPAPRGADWTL